MDSIGSIIEISTEDDLKAVGGGLLSLGVAATTLLRAAQKKTAKAVEDCQIREEESGPDCPYH